MPETRLFCVQLTELPPTNLLDLQFFFRRRRRHDAAGPHGGALRVCVPPWTQPALHGATTSHRVAHPPLDILAVPPQRVSL